ncbi:MAG TPA: helix-turn-helix domain-containing protein [Terriglobales bacterium]|jgi:transcriptional regulator with XRE-family HTH domain
MSVEWKRRRREFGLLLRKLRKEQRLTCKELAERIGANFSAVAAIERGVRQAGAAVAERLANALRLRDEEKTRFMVKALATTRRDMVPESARGFDPELYRPLWAMLEKRRIRPQDIQRITFDTPIGKSSPAAVRKAAIRLSQRLAETAGMLRSALGCEHHSPGTDLLLELKDGSVVMIQFTSVKSK